MDGACVVFWKTILDNLMTHDKTTFKDLLGDLPFCSDASFLNQYLSLTSKFSQTDTGFGTFLAVRVVTTPSASLNLFSSREVEFEQKAALLKRLSFTVFCSETDQYTKYLPDIQGVKHSSHFFEVNSF